MTDQQAHVIRLVTDEELLFSLGSNDNVKPGDEFTVLDRKTLDVMDGGQDYGSIERVKATVRVTQVNQRMALARVVGRSRGISSIASVMSGEPSRALRLTSRTWPEGVEAMDPVVASLI